MDKKKSIMEEKLPSPALFSAIYFSVLSAILTLLIQLTISSTGFKQVAPFFLSLLLGMFVAFIFGGLYGKCIINARPPFKLRSFLYGVALFLTAFPFYALGFMFIVKHYQADTYVIANNFHAYLAFYLYILNFTFFLLGSWLCILCGFASLYLRAKLIPHFLAFQKKQAAHPH